MIRHQLRRVAAVRSPTVRIAQQAILAFFAGLLAWSFYSYMLARQYAALEKAVLKADVIGSLLARDAAIPEFQSLVAPTVLGEDGKLLRFASLARQLELGQVVGKKQGEIMDSDLALVWKAIDNEKTDCVWTWINSTRSSCGTLSMIADFVVEEGTKNVPDEGPPTMKELAAIVCDGVTAGVNRDPGQESDTAAQMKSCLATWLGRTIAGFPADRGGSSAGHLLVEKLRAMTTDEVAPPETGAPDFRYVFRPRLQPSDQEIIGAMLDAWAWTDPENGIAGRLIDTQDAGDVPKNVRRLDVLTEFIAGLLSEIRNDPGVRSAGYWVVMWRGGEQFVILWIGILVVMLSVVSVVTTQRERRQAVWVQQQLLTWSTGAAAPRTMEVLSWLGAALERETTPRIDRGNLVHHTLQVMFETLKGVRSVQRSELIDLFGQRLALERERAESRYDNALLLTSIVPGVGFLGTVLGIMGALGNADQIARAVTRVDKVNAVLEIAGTLGLAFATTAIALLFSIPARTFLQFEQKRVRTTGRELDRHVTQALWAVGKARASADETSSVQGTVPGPSDRGDVVT